MSNNKPIPIESYQCPHCDKIMNCGYDEAQEHIDIPVDDEFPIGFVYRRESGPETKDGEFHIVVGTNGINQEDHSHNLIIKGFYHLSQGEICKSQMSYRAHPTSKDLRKELLGDWGVQVLKTFAFQYFKEDFDFLNEKLGIEEFTNSAEGLEHLAITEERAPFRPNIKAYNAAMARQFE